MDILIRPVQPEDKRAWFDLRKALFPESSDGELTAEQDAILSSERDAAFLAYADGALAGMIEAHLREYAEGCDTSPVGYIEAWYVREPFRGKGVAGALVHAAEDWARAKGCSEMASDTWLENAVSIRAHEKLGYREAERLVCFVKKL